MEKSFLIGRWWMKETSCQDVLSFGRPREKLWKNMPLQKRSGAAVTSSGANENVRAPGTLCFFHRHYPGKRAETAMRGRYLGPAALIGPHGRSSWWVRFGGRAYLCATEHLRGVTPDEADRLGIDERRPRGTRKLRGLDIPARSPATSGGSDRTIKGTRGAVTR